MPTVGGLDPHIEIWADGNRPSPRIQALLDGAAPCESVIPIAYLDETDPVVTGPVHKTLDTAVIGETESGATDILLNLAYGAVARGRPVLLLASGALCKYTATALQYLDSPVSTIDIEQDDALTLTPPHPSACTVVRVPPDGGSSADAPVFTLLAALIEQTDRSPDRPVVIVDTPTALCQDSLDETAIRAVMRSDEVDVIVHTPTPTALTQQTQDELVTTAQTYLVPPQTDTVADWMADQYDYDFSDTHAVGAYTVRTPTTPDRPYQIVPPTHGVRLTESGESDTHQQTPSARTDEMSHDSEPTTENTDDLTWRDMVVRSARRTDFSQMYDQNERL